VLASSSAAANATATAKAMTSASLSTSAKNRQWTGHYICHTVGWIVRHFQQLVGNTITVLF
jgi:hypothetical protein